MHVDGLDADVERFGDRGITDSARCCKTSSSRAAMSNDIDL